ncbi:MAG TPA: hypothetical protein VIN05_05115 [Roseovarius sp.]
MERYLDTDEQHDVMLSLAEVLHQLERVAAGDVHCWKWAVIALASAVNGALVCNLTGTMQVGAFKEDNAKLKIAASQKDSTIEQPEKPFLARPTELLKRAVRANQRIENAGGILKINAAQKKAFNKLFHFRNSFIHFEPLGWTIETSGMSEIFERVLEIVGQVIDDGWAFRHLNDHDRQRLRNVQHDTHHLLATLTKSTI